MLQKGYNTLLRIMYTAMLVNKELLFLQVG